jgi:membrane associated rhomboid family serine protease
MRPVVLGFLAINAGVFALWLILGQSPFMLENFLVSWDALVAGRTWTLLTSEFSHLVPLHFFINMVVLWSFGPIVEYTIGSARFLSFYLFAAVVASLAHAVVSAFVLGQPALPALGASGAIAGVILLFALIYPRARILMFGFIPVPALFGALLFVGLDVAGLIWQAEGGGLPIGHGAHLGGAMMGVLYYFLVIRPLRVRQPQRIDFGSVATWRRLIDQQGQRDRDRDGG